MPAAKALRGLPDRSAQKYPTMESRPHNLLNPKHLRPFRHLRIHPGTTRHLLRSTARKAPLRGQHSRNENPPMHLAWRPEQRPPSASGLAAGGRLDQVPQSQLQRRQDPLADSGKSPVEQASQMPSQSTPHSPALVQQTCAQYFQTPEFTQGLTQIVLKFVSGSLEAVKTQLSGEQEQALQRMETTFSHRMEKIEAAINHLYDMHAQSSPTRKHKQRKCTAACSPQPTEQANSPQSGVSTPTVPQHGEF
ncbi:hypothetical protein MTO96_008737 [Rhipicephalus appendiculatus]